MSFKNYTHIIVSAILLVISFPLSSISSISVLFINSLYFV